jgi:phenylalanyl-tRNA synthetase beta chain
VLNPPSENLNYLRPSLLFGILKAISLNQKLQDRLSFFEIGKIFFKNGKIFEEEKASGAIFGFKDIFFLKSELQSLFEKIGIYSFEIFPSNELPKLFPFFEKGASGKVIFQNNKELGFFGKISKEILDFYLIKAPVFAFELDLNSLFKLSSKKKFEPISPYPLTFRDLSIALPKEVLSFSLYQKLKKAGGKLLKNIELLDVYQGPPLPQDKKSLTFRLTFQSPKKPLLAKEVNLIIERIKKNLPKSWEIRD